MGKTKEKKEEPVTMDIFITIEQAYMYCKNQPPGYFKERIDNTSDDTLDASFFKWRNNRKHAFSPVEYDALASDKNTKDAKANEFVDWGEELPRRIAVIILEEDELTGCTKQAKKVDTIGGDNTFTTGLSASGEEPVTHYMTNWNCSQREYEFFEEIEGEGDWNLYDGEITPWQEVLINQGLQKI